VDRLLEANRYNTDVANQALAAREEAIAQILPIPAHQPPASDARDAEITRLRSVCAEAYQMAGALGAPAKALDNLSAAASGSPLPHDTFLPVAPAPDAEPSDAEMLDWLEEYSHFRIRTYTQAGDSFKQRSAVRVDMCLPTGATLRDAIRTAMREKGGQR
jgi:hypothetical protein